MASNPRINDAIVFAIRIAKMPKYSMPTTVPKIYHFMHNMNRPDKAFTTERAKKAGKANACCGKIFVTMPADHFGPITAEYDPVRSTGVLVGESWEDRMECRQWGTHLPHVAGIAGQSEYGAQSVALSGGYIDDEDHGEWFLYTGRYIMVDSIYLDQQCCLCYTNSLNISSSNVVKVVEGISVETREPVKNRLLIKSLLR